MNTSIVYAEFTKKKVFDQLTVGAGSPAWLHHGRQKVSIPECDPGDTTSKVSSLLSVLKIAILMRVYHECPMHSTEK